MNNDWLTDVMGGDRKWLKGSRVVDGKLIYAWYMSGNAAIHLKKCKLWLVDGTFHTCSNGFKVLLNVMGFDGKTFVPCAHFLLPAMTADCYQQAFSELFNILHKFEGDFQVRRIMTDFELALRNGIHSAWTAFCAGTPCPYVEFPLKVQKKKRPDWRLRFSGCLFHYGQAVHRRVRKNYASKTNRDHVLAYKILSFFLWLPYFEPARIANLFARLVCNMEGSGRCEDLLEYFRKTWVNCIDWWCIDRADKILTNCGVEVFHRDLKRKLDHVAHPSVETLKGALFRFQADRLFENSTAGVYDPSPNYSARRKMATGSAGWELVQERIEAFANDPLGCRDGIGLDALQKELDSRVSAVENCISEENNEPITDTPRGEKGFNRVFAEEKIQDDPRFTEESDIAIEEWDLMRRDFEVVIAGPIMENVKTTASTIRVLPPPAAQQAVRYAAQAVGPRSGNLARRTQTKTRELFPHFFAKK
jgi:hypothetical protein